jgi:hypothetical protein
VKGQAPAGVELWALLFTDYPIHAAKEVKIVWRMTGRGDLALRALGPQDQQLRPEWGPEPHTGSNWNRPGGEWGSGFIFPASGCWTVLASRGPDSGVTNLLVID